LAIEKDLHENVKALRDLDTFHFDAFKDEDKLNVMGLACKYGSYRTIKFLMEVGFS